MQIKNRDFRHGLVLAIALLLFLLAACSQEEPTPVPEPTATAVPPTATPTETPLPTDTPAPTATPLPPTETPQPAPAAENGTPRFEEASCEFEVPAGREVECGYLVVPADRQDPADEDTMRLHVAIFASESDNPEPDPIVYLEGGPGGDALELVPFGFEERFSPFLENRALIMFDQRGTGYAEPSLACPEYTEMSLDVLDDVIPPEEQIDLFLDVLGTCRERLLSAGVELDEYDSAASAADVADLQQVLGYEQINLYGISYGTRLAQTIMRDYPAGIRSVILDSSYPIEADIVEETPANVARAFQAFFEGCAADPACNGAYPDLDTAFFDLVDALDEEPITVPVFHLFNRETYDARLVGDDLIGLLFQGLYSAEIIPTLPQMIADTAAGDYGLLSTFLSNFILNDEFVSIGMQYSVQCQEEVPFAELAEVEEAVAAYPRLQEYFVSSPSTGEAVFEICDLWDVPPAPAAEDEAISSDLPTLVLAGEYDPITPPAWGELVAGNLENAYFFFFPGLGHGVSLDGGCALQVTKNFLVDPSTEPDATCIAQMAGPPFIVPGETTDVTLVPFTTTILGSEVSGVVPEGWEEISPGTFARQESGLDQTALVQQAVPGLNAADFLDLLSGQLGLEEAPAQAETVEVGGRIWSLYQTELQGQLVDIALAEDTFTYVVVLFSSLRERPYLYEAVLLPVLEAIEVE